MTVQEVADHLELTKQSIYLWIKQGKLTSIKVKGRVLIEQEQVLAHKPIASAGCFHEWMLDQPNGPTSSGTCRKCGETKEFANSDEAREGYDGKRESMRMFNKYYRSATRSE